MPVHRHPIAVSKATGSLLALPLDQALVQRLKATYALVRSKDAALAVIFYAKLFAAAPSLRPLFRSDLDAQAKKLIAALDAVVRNFEHPVENAAMLAALGRRHVAYGAKPEHYGLVIDLLVESMQELAGTAASPRDIEEWRMALRLISDQMIAAATEPGDPGETGSRGG